jgi:hypothetical protein
MATAWLMETSLLVKDWAVAGTDAASTQDATEMDAAA